ncbi:MAG: HAD family phosphatase [Acidobacteriota bacterium]|jgi:putative hydrolase of the HAD superfamily|nr:HAD family phosphatase [Acidobacteriota bacterium]
MAQLNTPAFDVLLFDLGGVLIDFAGFDELRHLLPGGVSRDEVRESWISSPFVQRFERAEITPDVFARGVVSELGLDLGPDEFIDAFVGWARGPYPGARSLLGMLQKEARLACLSNSNTLHTPLHRRSMEPLLDVYYFSNELGKVKPDREIYEHVIRDLDVPPRRIAFFDDTRVNVQTAREVGIRAFEVDGIMELEAQLQGLGVL